MNIRIKLGASLMLAIAVPAAAHHSFAMFDNEKTVTLVGVVKEFQWTNPHIWVQVLVPDNANGSDTEWSIEGASPNGLRRQGWSRASLKAGDKVELKIHPMKDGSHGGSLVSIAVDGKKIGN